MKQNLRTNVSSEALEFLGPLIVLLDRGNATYQRYMANGKAFLYAKILKDNNARIRQVVIEKSYLLPLDHQPHVIELLTHIDVWYERWEALDAKKAHALSDEFAFENEVTFPRASVDALRRLYVTLKTDSLRIDE